MPKGVGWYSVERAPYLPQVVGAAVSLEMMVNVELKEKRLVELGTKASLTVPSDLRQGIVEGRNVAIVGACHLHSRRFELL